MKWTVGPLVVVILAAGSLSNNAPAHAQRPQKNSGDTEWTMSSAGYPGHTEIKSHIPTQAGMERLFGAFQVRRYSVLGRIDKRGWLESARLVRTSSARVGKTGGHVSHVLSWRYGVSLYHSNRQANNALAAIRVGVPMMPLTGVGESGKIVTSSKIFGGAQGEVPGTAQYATLAVFVRGAIEVEQLCMVDAREKRGYRHQLDAFCTRERNALIRILNRAVTVTVPGTADIFGAGLSVVPGLRDNQGGMKGGGTLPPMLPVMPGETLTISASGQVSCAPTLSNGPDGGCPPYTTDITSYGGVSGITDHKSAFFLVGVFLTDTGSLTAAPESLDFSPYPNGLSQNFAKLRAQLGQSFFIGDGTANTGARANGLAQHYIVPAKATRLYLGFADTLRMHGEPGYYDDNGGQLSVTVMHNG